MQLRLIKTLLSHELTTIIFFILNMFVVMLIFTLEYGMKSIYYPLLLSIILLCLYLVIKYIKIYKLDQESKNFQIANFKSEISFNKYDQIYISMIDEIHHNYLMKINKMYDRNKKNDQLLSQFFHNMKTSVAVIELASNRDNVEVLKDIKVENKKLKLQLEQSLNILRLDSFIQDYLPQKYSLQDIIVDVINENKSSFIYNEIYPKVVGEDIVVFTDRKWLKYLIEQLVSNAIKYSDSKSTVEFIIEDGCLKVTDYGIGIKNNELDKIFDLFYTGTNGRISNESTGIGLSMVKTVAQMLDLDISVISEVNKGTTFTLTFLTKM